MKSGVKWFLFWGDLVALVLSFFIMLGISFPNDILSAAETHMGPFLVLYALWIAILYIFNLYESAYVRPGMRSLSQLGLSFITMCVIGFLMFYLVPWYEISPKTNLVINVLLFGAFILIWRRLFGYRISRLSRELAVIVGDHSRKEELARMLSKDNPSGLVFTGTITTFEELNPEIKTIIFMSPPERSIIKALAKKEYRILTALQVYETIFNRVPTDLIDEKFLSILPTKTNLIFYPIGRLVEIILAVIVLIVSLPITVISILLIYIEDRGPVFYTHTRVGKNGRTFRFFKFRSMRIDAEKDGVQWTKECDERITKVGMVMRKLHIDEIPQMLNIILGDITLVGPRPERPEFVRDLSDQIPFYDLRHRIKPGFTGWAQINFQYARTVADSERKLEYDLYYVAHKNIFLDFGILLKTVQIIFTH